MEINEGLAEAKNERQRGGRERSHLQRKEPSKCKSIAQHYGSYEFICMWMGVAVRGKTGKGFGFYTKNNKEPWKDFK